MSMSCGIANRPISAVRKWMPPSMLASPKVKRAVPIIGSWPTVTISRPIAADKRPLTTDFAAKPQITVSPKNTRLNRSGARKRSAMSARLGAIR